MSTYKQLTGVTIKDSFDNFHLTNPQVYSIFEAKAFTAIRMGKTKMSSKLILNVIRWEAFIQTTDPNSTYKINDAYTSHYARLFAEKNPAHADVFNYRALRA
tara:strand:+ start:938 stop:1243 length:306 start_codon:yes stop_codon:yes gene_type:complete